MDAIEQQLASLRRGRSNLAAPDDSTGGPAPRARRQLVSARLFVAVVAASAAGLFTATLSPIVGVVVAAMAGGLLSGLVAGVVAAGVAAAGGPALHAVLALMTSPLDWAGSLAGLAAGVALRLFLRARWHGTRGARSGAARLDH
jgi:hypothetical protein